MRFFRRALVFFVIAIVLLAGWSWWNRPKKVDMTAYVPADSLLYLEANSFSAILSGLTSTDSWRDLAVPAGIGTRLGYVSWYNRLAAWIGIGSADTIVFSRMQIAAVVLSVAAADGGETLNLRPRIGLVIETHTSASRTRAAIEKHVGNFARRAYGEPRIEQRDVEDTHWIVWSSTSSQRRIIAAIRGSVAIIGNDEAAVQTCLAVGRGERPSLAGNHDLEEARRHVAATESLTFGFLSPQGSGKFFEVAAAIYAGQISDDPKSQGLAADVIPQIARKVVGSIGWSAKVVNGAIEDRYFVALPNDGSARLREALTYMPVTSLAAASLLPSQTYSMTRYSANEPLTAWRALSFSISSQLDPVLAVMVAPILNASLVPYGIDEPDVFLSAIGPEVCTARIRNAPNESVVVAAIRDEPGLRSFVSKRLGTLTPQTERLGDADILFSLEAKRGAFSFVNGYFLMGSKENVRACLDARRSQQTLSLRSNFQRSLASASLFDQPHTITFTEDVAPAQAFISFMANQKSPTGLPIDAKAVEEKLSQRPYAIVEMTFVEGGIERRTRSSFGLMGVLATQFATRN